MFISLTAPATVSSNRPGIIQTIARMIEVSRQRKHLARLDNAALEDLGLTRQQVLDECNRPTWDAPAHWKN